jgi:hypothetical protein
MSNFFVEHRQMSAEVATTVTRYRPKPRPDITIAGQVWTPRANLADKLGFTDRTAARMNWRTTYVAGIAYCPVEESLADIVARARRRHEPVKHRRPRG